DVTDIDPVKLRRKVGYAIQSSGLFPHMTVAQKPPPRPPAFVAHLPRQLAECGTTPWWRSRRARPGTPASQSSDCADR
ncbi:hypothetical protein AB0C58_35455, partial [Streptomyces parvulus]